MLIAQISDTHLSLDPNDDDRDQRIRDFERTIADINSLDPTPDVIVHTGDIVHYGHEDEYAAASEILSKANAPAYVIPGNKDERANLRTAFGNRGYLSSNSNFIDYVIEDFPYRLLFLDTLDPSSNKGDFCEVRATRANALIERNKEKPVIVFAHHPPFEVPVGPDPVHFETEEAMSRLRTVLQQSGRVAALFCGHVHRFSSGMVGEVPVSVITAISTTLRKGEYPQAASGRPLYQLHDFADDGSFETETRIVKVGG